ncbi:MAG: metallophosphoesterase family protein [Methyloligellaceae bacterium]
MRIALISDIHGNAVALEAVLADIARVGADQVICLGDVATLGPEPQSSIESVRKLACPCILGNHDEFLLDPGLIETYTDAQVVVESVNWCRAQLAAKELEFFRTFQPSLKIRMDESATLLLYHGSPKSNMHDILVTTPPDELDDLLGGEHATVMAGGHTHVQMLRQHMGTLIVNPGSVGLPFEAFVAGAAPTLLPTYAEYATVEAGGGSVSVDLRRVAVDVDALRRAVQASDVPLRDFLLEQYDAAIGEGVS